MFLKISQILQENNCVGVSFNKAVYLRACNFIKRRLQNRCFLVKFANFYEQRFYRTPPVTASDILMLHKSAAV